MHITLVNQGPIPIPPSLYGGAQRGVYWLGKAFVELGHQVTLIANPRSHIEGAELRGIDPAENTTENWLRLIPDATDIVQVCGRYPGIPRKPFLVRFGGNPPAGTKFHANTVFLSKRHAASFGSRHFVHNGLDVAEYSFSEKRDNYAVFLAKARWDVKNLKGAQAVARRAGLELRVLGSRNWPLNLQRWLPAIRGVRYYGMIGGEEKRELLARARCLIFPVRWHEPFGIAAIEALVSGAYVAATPYGSLPEIVTPECGVVSADGAELAEAVAHPERFQPQAARNRVLNGGFTHIAMAKKYLSYYEQILTKGTLDGEPPVKRAEDDSKELLPWKD